MDECFAVIFDALDDGIAHEIEDAEAWHGRHDVDKARVLKHVVRKVQHTNARTRQQALHVVGCLEPVVVHRQRG